MMKRKILKSEGIRFIIAIAGVSIIVAVAILLILIANNPNVLWENKNKKICSDPVGLIMYCENLLFGKNDIVSFCKQVVELDLNGDGKLSTVQYKQRNICEYSIFCWSVLPEYMARGDICAIELCKYYIYTENLSPEEATLKVFGYYNMEKSETLSIGDQEAFKDKMLEFNNYKDIKKEKLGHIFFVPAKCTTDDAVAMAYREIGKEIFPMLDKNKTSYELGITKYNNSDYGYLYISKSSISENALSKIAALYGDNISKIPDKVPLCALLTLLSS